MKPSIHKVSKHFHQKTCFFHHDMEKLSNLSEIFMGKHGKPNYQKG